MAAAAGNDTVRADDGQREVIRCGPGDDRAIIDRSDHPIGCERLGGAGAG
jgi:hypothetical protein